MLKLTRKLLDYMIEKHLTNRVLYPDKETVEIWRRAAAECLLNGELDVETYGNLTDGPDLSEDYQEDEEEEGDKMTVSAKKVFSGNGDEAPTRIRVKAPSEGLSEKRHNTKHAKTGQTVLDAYGYPASSPSEKSLAMAGVLLKQSAKRSGLPVEMSEWEQTLWSEMIEEEQWASFQGEPYEEKIYSGSRVKALLDDATSGGLEIAPITFDADIVSNVLLTGELFPFVDLKPVSRGRRVEGASVGHPTIVWGTGEGTEGGLQDFSSYVASIDTTIYPATCFCEVGRDLLADSAVNLGDIVVRQVSEKYLEEMDKVICVGNGTTQPEGIVYKTGTTAVAFGNATSLSNYESMLFGVSKQYRKAPGNTFVFCGTETSYQRARGIPLGTGDARRIFGLNVEDYTLYPPRPYKINESLTNSQIFAGDLKRYRMYQRLGMQTQWSTEGKSLMRSNTALLAVRFRYGGQVVLPAAFAVATDAPA